MARENPFKSVAQVTLWIKLLLYGAWGSGKTYFGLGAPGKVAVIDTEGGTAFYKGMFPDFDVLTTKSYRDVLNALDWIESNPGMYQTLVIDPVTVLYETLQDAALKARVARKARSAGSGFDPDEVDLEIKDWGQIKRRYKALMTRLANMRCHVIVVAREKDDTVMKGSEIVKVGVKPDAEKGTSYYFDVVVRAVVKGESRVFTVEKARGVIGQSLPLGSQHIDPTFLSMFGAALKGEEEPKAKGKKAEPKADRVVPSDEAASAKDAADFGEKIASPEMVDEFIKVLDSLGFDPEEVRARRNWPPFNEMPEAVIAEALAKLRETKPRPAPAPDPEEEADPGFPPQQSDEM
jgi:hypothetical protein